MFYELTSWYRYRQISHSDTKYYVWVFPIILSLILFGCYYCVDGWESLFAKQGLMTLISQAVIILPGFFIAALAAVSTFNLPGLEDHMDSLEDPEASAGDENEELRKEQLKSGERVEMPMRTNGIVEPLRLTNRRFLTVLFSYLTVLSFSTMFLSSFLSFIMVTNYGPESVDSFFEIASKGEIILIGVIFTFILYLFSSLIASTLHGIYFLAERIHRPSGT